MAWTQDEEGNWFEFQDPGFDPNDVNIVEPTITIDDEGRYIDEDTGEVYDPSNPGNFSESEIAERERANEAWLEANSYITPPASPSRPPYLPPGLRRPPPASVLPPLEATPYSPATAFAGGGFTAHPELGRLIITPVAGVTEQQVISALRYYRGLGGWTLQETIDRLQEPGFVVQVAEIMRLDPAIIKGIFEKILATGISGILMALTGNFPLAAMGYFATDRALGTDTGVRFQGWLAGNASADGQPLLPIGMPVPEGLPNEIFNDFRFICFDRLSQRWWPSDEVRPLSYQGDSYRWLAMDRVDGKMYHANWIKKPVVYI